MLVLKNLLFDFLDIHFHPTSFPNSADLALLVFASSFLPCPSALHFVTLQ